MRKLVIIIVGILLVGLLAACGGAPAPAAVVPPAEIDLTTLPPLLDVQTVDSLRQRSDVVMIDVREQFEYDEAHIPGVTLIPMSELEQRVNEIPRDKTVILSCRSGNRSSDVQAYLESLGYDNVHDMQGGILAWQRAGLPVE